MFLNLVNLNKGFSQCQRPKARGAVTKVGGWDSTISLSRAMTFGVISGCYPCFTCSDSGSWCFCPKISGPGSYPGVGWLLRWQGKSL